MAQHGCRELAKSEFKEVQDFLRDAPRYPTLLMRRAAAFPDEFKGGWYAALMDRRVEALCCMESGTTIMYGSNNEAIRTMAQRMLSVQRKRPRTASGTHQIIGEEIGLGQFWDIFQHLGRTVVLDRRRDLLSVQDPDKPAKSTLVVGPAKPADFKLVYEFSADQTVDQWGWDPRRISPEAHKNRVTAVMEEGRQLIGRDAGRPVFLAERTSIEDETVLLERVYIPRPFRRQKLLSSALLAAARFALGKAKEVVFFADQNDAAMKKALALTNFEAKCIYRVLILRG